MRTRVLLLSFFLFAVALPSFGQDRHDKSRHPGTVLDSVVHRAFVWQGNPVAFGETMVIVTINVGENVILSDVDVILDIDHSWDSDVSVTLIAPNETSVDLFSNVGGDGDNFVGTYLDDGASESIAQGTAPFSGVFRPMNPLSAFSGVSGRGVWTLRVVDNYPEADDGVFNGWTLILSGQIIGQIHGRIISYETGQPLAGISVRTVPAEDSTHTNSSGLYTLILDAGMYDIEIAGTGWCTERIEDLVIADQDSFEYDFAMRSPTCDVSSTSLNREVAEGGVDVASLELRNNGNCDLIFATQTDVPWLHTDVLLGTVARQDTFVLRVVSDAHVLQAGDYIGTLRISHNSLRSPLLIPVFLSVTPAAGADDPPRTLPDKFALSGNYPNPFNTETTVMYDVPRLAAVTLDLFNLRGQRVKQLLAKTVAAGHQSLHFDAADLSSGVYFLKMTAPEFTATSKLVLLK